MIELSHAIALPLVLTKHPEPRTLTRQNKVYLKMKRFVVFSGTQMASHKTLSGESLLIILQFISPFSINLSSLYHCTSCKVQLYQRSPPFNLYLKMNHTIQAEIDMCKPSRAH